MKKILGILLVIFGFLGFADASYLTAEHYVSLPLPCSLTGGCDVVLHSAYAMLWGVPISLFGALYYLVVFILALQFLLSGMEQRMLVRTVALLTGIGVAVSAVLVYLQAFVIREWCMYCLGSALTTLLLFIFSATFVYLSSRKQPRTPHEHN